MHEHAFFTRFDHNAGMDYRIALPLLGGLLIAVGVYHAGLYLACSWLGVCFLVLGLAHIFQWPRIFGKRANGRLPLWSWLAFLPLHLLSLGVWHLARLLSREAPLSQINERMMIGRRPITAAELPECDLLIDLTSEFAEVRAAREHPGYHALPILDGSIPERAELDRLLEDMAGRTVFIHCAQGHGRSGTVAIAFLLKTGQVETVEEGLRLLQAQRPALDLGRRQRAFLGDYAKYLGKAESTAVF